jgi:MFS family permease
MALSLATMALSSSLVGITLGMALQQCSGCLMFVTAMTYMTSIAPPLQRGRYAGAWWFFYLGANFAAPLVTAALRAVTGTHVSSVVAVSVLSLAPISWLFISRHWREVIVPRTAVSEAHTCASSLIGFFRGF